MDDRREEIALAVDQYMRDAQALGIATEDEHDLEREIRRAARILADLDGGDTLDDWKITNPSRKDKAA